MHTWEFLHIVSTLEINMVNVVNWSKEVKPHLFFSHRLNTKSLIFYLPLLLNEATFSLEIFYKKAEAYHLWLCNVLPFPPRCRNFIKWAASSEFGTYRLCEQRRFRRACASAQSRQNLRCSLIQAMSQEEPSDRKTDPWPLWMAGHAQLNVFMTECSKTQIRLTRPKCRVLFLISWSFL